MNFRRILTIQDISCVGQCSLTVALPIISACGLECSILPSAVLSTHTAGEFRKTGFSCRDLTEDFPEIESYWKKGDIKFNAIYTGYLGSTKQVEYVRNIFKSCLIKDGYRIVDPAMGDDGSLYPAFDDAYVKAMAGLCADADIIIPNITEASFLTGMEYKSEYDELYIIKLCEELFKLCKSTIVMTGVSFDKETTGVYLYDGQRKHYYKHELVEKSYHGTGDIFSSAFVGAFMRGHTLERASQIAADFTCAAIKNTMAVDEHWYGVMFEPLLVDLANTIYN